MEKMNFEQMEVLNGGSAQVVAAAVNYDLIDGAKKSCLAEGTIVLVSGILSLGMTGFTAGLSWGLTAWAYKDYFMCQYNNMH
jgi:hypothetical protein